MRAHRRELVPFRDAFRWWLKLGFINFGGPAGQIAVMHDELVDRRRWVSNDRFLHALNFCMLLPGPEATQLAIYIGWLLNGTLGGIVAGVLFVLPAFFLILGLSWAYAAHGDIEWVAAIFYGLQAAVVGIVAAAVIRLGRKALKHPVSYLIAATAFLAIFFLQVPFPIVIVIAGLVGLTQARLSSSLLPVAAEGVQGKDDAVIGDAAAEDMPTSGRRALRVIATGLLVWWGPLLAVLIARGPEDTLSRLAIFFSKAAMVTFGGAYAVLAYINQAAVETYGWLEPGQMVTGLGLAESTPGPLIMVTEFVGYLAAFRFPGGSDPALAGILGAVVATWATFAPCFLWILLGAPYIERLRGNRSLNAALSAITAAVVGVVLNLAVTFAIFALFGEVGGREISGVSFPFPNPGSADVFAIVVAVVAFTGLWRYRWNVVAVVVGASVSGLVYRLLL